MKTRNRCINIFFALLLLLSSSLIARRRDMMTAIATTATVTITTSVTISTTALTPKNHKSNNSTTSNSHTFYVQTLLRPCIAFCSFCFYFFSIFVLNIFFSTPSLSLLKIIQTEIVYGCYKSVCSLVCTYIHFKKKIFCCVCMNCTRIYTRAHGFALALINTSTKIVFSK